MIPGLRFLDPLRREKRLLPLIVMIGLIMIGNGIVSPILSLYAQSFGVASTLVGMIVTIFGIGRLCANLPAGYLSQRVGRRPLLAAGPLVVAASSAGAALTNDFASLLMWRFLQGVGSGIYQTTSLAALADVSPPKSRAGNLALYQASVQLGASLGPAAGGYLANYFGFQAPFWAYMAVGILAAGTALFSFEDTLTPRDVHKPLSSSIGRKGMMSAPFTAICILTCIVFFTRAATLFQLIPLLGHDFFGLDVGAVGLALTLSAFMNFAVLPMAAPLIERFGARANVFGSTIVSAISLATVYAAPSVFWFWVGVVGLGLASGISYPATSSFTIACLSRDRYGPGMGMQRTFGDIGFVFGPVIVGALADISGGHFAGTLLNVLLLAAAALVFLAFSRGIRVD